MPETNPFAGPDRRSEIPPEVRLLVIDTVQREIEVRIAPLTLTSEERALIKEMGQYFKARKALWDTVQKNLVTWLVIGFTSSFLGLIGFVLKYFVFERKGPL